MVINATNIHKTAFITNSNTDITFPHSTILSYLYNNLSMSKANLFSSFARRMQEDCPYLNPAPVTLRQRPGRTQYVLEVLINVAETCLNLKINLAFQFILYDQVKFSTRLPRSL
jgi:hypothetical protein